MRKWSLPFAAILCTAMAAAPQAARAQAYGQLDNGPFTAVASAQLTSLIDRVDALEASLSNLDDGAKCGCDLEWVDTHDEFWTHVIGGRVHMDYVTRGDQNSDNRARFDDLENYFAMRRLRLFVAGCGYGVYDYMVELEFGVFPDDSGTDIEAEARMKDVYIGIYDTPYLGYVRMGHFKAPFSLEELTSSKHLTFMERGLPNVYSPGHEVGIAAYNQSCEGTIHWAGGIFWDDIDEDDKGLVDDIQGTTVVGRAVYLPYYDEPSCGRYLLHTGSRLR